jgi:hypothetical protein
MLRQRPRPSAAAGAISSCTTPLRFEKRAPQARQQIMRMIPQLLY